MTSIQVCPFCHEPFNADTHKFGGFCTALHRTLYEREHRPARPQPPVPPATWQERARKGTAVTRRNGVDNRRTSG